MTVMISSWFRSRFDQRLSKFRVVRCCLGMSVRSWRKTCACGARQWWTIGLASKQTPSAHCCPATRTRSLSCNCCGRFSTARLSRFELHLISGFFSHCLNQLVAQVGSLRDIHSTEQYHLARRCADHHDAEPFSWTLTKNMAFHVSALNALLQTWWLFVSVADGMQTGLAQGLPRPADQLGLHFYC